MKRAVVIAGMVMLLAMLAACSGGDGDVVDPNVGPLTIQLLWAEPGTGSSPLRVVFTVNITGGEAPYNYAWDFTNDGSFDTYQNGEFRRTISADYEYYLKASDAGGVTQYEALLTVTDSKGIEITSAPVAINVMGTSGLTIEPGLTGAYSDEIDAEGFYVFTSGNPVYFRAYPIGGTAPYTYQWDFDNDGAADSTIATPQYTFSYTGVGVRMFVVSLTIIDANGEQVMWDFYVEVENPDPGGPPPPPPFDIVINSTPPADAGNVINIDFDPTGNNAPEEPELDLAVIVNPGTPGGSPPYEYYWDFEYDGAIDSQVLSPTIPYYDSGRKILINPYMHQEDVKSFTLRCMVIDSNGFVQEAYRTIVARDVAGRNDPVEVTYGYAVAGQDVPFAEANNRASITNAQFSFDITGAPGSTYQYQFDANGDGMPETYDGDSDGTPDPLDGGWYVAGAASIGVPVNITINVAYKGIGYFPANMTIRAVSPDSTVVDTIVTEVPVSLVKRSQYSMDTGVLDPRANHCIVADWTAIASPANDQALSEREIIVVGGAQGTTPLNAVQRILQIYTVPTTEGQIEILASTGASTRTSLNQERSGSVMWIASPETGPAATITIHGGENIFNGYLAATEQSNGGGGTVPWAMLNEIRIPGFYPLKDAGGTFVPGVGYVIAGGLHKASAGATVVVSGKLITYDPDPVDTYEDTTSMQFERYDAGVAYANGKIYVIGGRVSSGQAVATVEVYDPVARQWDTFAPSLNEPRASFACEVVGGRIYVVGGGYWPNDESEATLLTTAEVFNPATGVWSHTLPLPANEEAEDLASTISPAPGGVSGVGALANSMLCMGGRSASGSETSAFYEFVYFTTVILPGPTEASISGYLTNALDSTPVEGIQVEISNASTWPVGDPPFTDSATTDATGFYEFVNLPTGTDRSYTVGIIFGGGYTWDPPFGQTFDPFTDDVTHADFQGTPE